MPTIDSQKIQTSAGKIHVAITGEGPPLLLIHGVLVSHKEWLLMLPHMTPHFRCILVDLPGFGESEKPDILKFSYQRQDIAKVLVEILDFLKIEKAHVCGHSMGGSIALTFAAIHSSRTEKLAVIDSVSFPFDIPTKGKVALTPKLGPMLFYYGYRRFVFQDYFKKDVFYDEDKIDWRQVNLYYDTFTPMNARKIAYANLKHTLELNSLIKLLPQIKAHTLVIWGKQDKLIPVDVGRRLHAALPKSEMVELNECGHAPNEEKPIETSNLLIQHFHFAE